MPELIAIPYRAIPEVLCHYTKPGFFSSIVSGKGGTDKEICFWANSNLCKNDSHELELGKRIYDIVKQWLKSCGKEDYLADIVDEKNSFSLSFTEEANPIEMIRKYGNIRLEFNLTGFYNKMELMPCEYCEETEIDRYAELLTDEFRIHFRNIEVCKHYTLNEKEMVIAPLILQGYGLNRSTVEKIFFLKSNKVWGEEKEWRKIYSGDYHTILYRPNNVPYIEVYLPIRCLKTIRLFNIDDIDPSLSSYQNKDAFEDYLAKHNWDVPVVIEYLQ